MSAPTWLAIAALGGTAAAARFTIDAAITARARAPFPLGILVVNVSGSLLVGAFAGAGLDGEEMAILAGGLTGSYTTFSGWILDSHRLAGEGLTRLAGLNLCVSLLAGFAAVVIGHGLGAVI